MKRCLPVFFLIILFNFSSKADIGIWGSAVYLNINGGADFYNTQKLTAPFAIGHLQFTGTSGVFGQNSGNLKISGAEINTTRDNLSAICNGQLYYTVYEQGRRPSAPAFSSFILSATCSCNGSTFNNFTNSACNNINDQKWQNVSKSIDLTGYTVGNYTLEIYYGIKGQNNGGACNLLRLDDAAGVNYSANFSIASPLALNFLSLNGNSGEKDIKIIWSILNDVEISRYEVQKSENGLSFRTIKNIASSRLPNISNYIFSDYTPTIGTNYYRIKVFNNNGTVNLSRVFRIYFGNVGNSVFIYPNPSGSELTVRFAAVSKGKYQLSILSIAGHQILTMPFYHDGIDKTIHIDMPQTMARGIYQLFLIDKVQFYKQAFLVK